VAEMRTLHCPSCNEANQPSTVVEGIEEYRCRACGLVYYGPSGCDTSDEIVGEGSASDMRLSGDFQMQRPTPAAGKEPPGQSGPAAS
jgi:hypothetical protein